MTTIALRAGPSLPANEPPGLGWVTALLAAALLCGCASWFGRNDAQQEALKRAESQMQQRVMRYADGYMDGVALAVRAVEEHALDTHSRRLLNDFQVKQSTAAVQIASGPNARINALDMLILATLTRHAVEQRLPPILGKSASPVVDAFGKLETNAWVLVDFLSPAQRDDLRDKLEAWKKTANSLDSVAFNRLADFARASGQLTASDGVDDSIYGMIGFDPFAGLSPAVKEIEQSRLLAERAIYYAQRSPMLLDLQTRSLSSALADMPESRTMLATSTRVGDAAAKMAETAALMPGTLSSEREAAIRQMFAALQQQQGTMTAMLIELRQSLEAGRAASDSVHGVVQSTDALLARLKVGEPPPPNAPPPGRPFNITEYTAAAAALGDTAQQIQSLVLLLEKDTPAAMKLAESARAQGEVLIDHLFKRLIQAFGVLFLGVLVIVVASRWISGHFQRKALQR
ncbi:hypothetical protein [Niveibacterium sp.]|uniref:hypothetical protein n=1 Tax=Niveibacterium sp. TaxID=2017444 RepID=UPI0035AE7301